MSDYERACLLASEASDLLDKLNELRDEEAMPEQERRYWRALMRAYPRYFRRVDAMIDARVAAAS